MCHLEFTTVPVIVEVRRIIKKEADKYIKKIFPYPRQYEMQKKLTLWNCSSAEKSTINMTRKAILESMDGA